MPNVVKINRGSEREISYIVIFCGDFGSLTAHYSLWRRINVAVQFINSTEVSIYLANSIFFAFPIFPSYCLVAFLLSNDQIHFG